MLTSMLSWKFERFHVVKETEVDNLGGKKTIIKHIKYNSLETCR